MSHSSRVTLQIKLEEERGKARIRLRCQEGRREERQWEDWEGNRAGEEREGMKKVNNMCTTAEFKLFKTTCLLPLDKGEKEIYNKELQGRVAIFLQASNSPRCANSQLPPNRKQWTV